MKRKHRLRKWIFSLLIIFLLLAGALFFVVEKAYSKLNYVPADAYTGESLGEGGAVNILLIGNDSRGDGEEGRSDAMILFSISDKTKSVQMISLLRDMYVEIPGHDGNRLNAAYAYGGPELLLQTVEENLGIEVHRYVQVNFEAFANLVDAVGGVELELSKEELEYVNGFLWEYNILTDRPEGTDYVDASEGRVIMLNGPQALAYSRNRFIGSDFARTERQRKVMTEVMKKLPVAVIKSPRELVNGLMPNLTTNLTVTECFRLCLEAGKLLVYEQESGSVPKPGTYRDANIRGMAVLEVDFEENKKWLAETIYGN